MADSHDRLSAAAGVASQFQKIAGDTYLAGLWERDLVLHLAWRSVPDLGWHRRRESTVLSPVVRAVLCYAGSKNSSLILKACGLHQGVSEL